MCTFLAPISRPAVLLHIPSSQALAPMTQSSTTLLQSFMLDEEMFLHSPDQRYAEKEFHTWVDSYGGDWATYTQVTI